MIDLISGIPLLFLFAWAFCAQELPPLPAGKTSSAQESKAGEKAGAIRPDPGLIALLRQGGFQMEADLSITFLPDKTRIGPELLQRAGIKLDQAGRLAYKNAVPLERDGILPILKGLLPFARAQVLSAREVGKALQAWGVPQAFDGTHLLNPDGSATYFGLMLYQGISRRPAAVGQLSGERLADAIKLFDAAHGQAFGQSSPHIASAHLNRAWDMLGWRRPWAGETALELKATQPAQEVLASHKAAVQAAKTRGGTALPMEELERALETLNAMEGQRYHGGQSLPAPPDPNASADGAATEEPRDRWGLSQRLLPALLRVLDKVHGRPLGAEEQEWLVKAFPMGESVWRMGGQDLWREELAGDGVKVAVIDNGVGEHEAFGDSVKSRGDRTRQSGKDLHGRHGTHVAGTVLALAPRVEIRSYKALDRDADEGGNPRTSSPSEDKIAAAIDDAVADGNHVVSISLGAPGHAGDALARKINAYAQKGTIFVISAGNDAWSGVLYPSIAPGAVSVGALDVNGRMAFFSSYGEQFDPVALRDVVKRIFLSPGTNIISTVPGDKPGENPYGKNSGTSMAAPHMSGGIFALLLEAARAWTGWTDPVALSRVVQDVVADTARPVPRIQIPSGVPADQALLIVDARAAYRVLRERYARPAPAM